jgi:predicted metal-dependent peptidase
MSTDHIRALDKAKVALMSKPDSVFYCEVAFSLKYIWDNSIPTACTNGIEMRINPAFFMQWNQEQRLGLILHETMHVGYMHPIRRGDRDHKIYNMAADYVINLVIRDRGYQLPDGGLYDPKYRGMSSEQVYDLLIQEQKSNPQKFEKDFSGGFMDDLSAPPEGVTPEEVEVQIEQTLVRAAIRSEQEKDKPGTIPGDIQLLINKLLKPKLPWHRILQKWLNTFAKNDYSWKKPNRRFQPDHYLPSLYSINLMDLVIAVDISGSVSEMEFQTFVSEVASIFKMMKPKKITLIQFDTEIKEISTIHSIQELVQVDFHGRGGTDILELVDWVNQFKPQLTMVFSDGEFETKYASSKQQFLWMIHNDRNKYFEAPFGKTIFYTIE